MKFRLTGGSFFRTTARIVARGISILGVATSAWAGEQSLLQFTGSNGSQPVAPLVFDTAGNLYGTASSGGQFGGGIVFKLTHTSSGWEESILHSFGSGNDGAFPTSGLVFDGKGNLYGTTSGGGGSVTCSGGCGIVFELARTPSGVWNLHILYRFLNLHDGANPAAGVIFDAKGNLYGTTVRGGGPSERGTVFKLSPTSTLPWKETVLHVFTGLTGDGLFPLGGLAIDASGNLYGTTSEGAGTGGMVFELKPKSDGTYAESILHIFVGSGDGNFPAAALIFDSLGNLYGTTVSGQDSTVQGTVFELLPNRDGTWTESILYSFQGGNDGSAPYASLVFDGAGNLYGTTKAGGGGVNCGPQAGGCGTMFKLTPSGTGTWTESVLVSFTSMTSSGYPLAGVILDAAGNLYGTTSINGVGNTASGEVFEVTP